MCLTMKRSLLYNSCGFAVWLCGFVFLSQSGGQAARDELNDWIRKAKRDKVWIYPEGTRNRLAIKTQTLLPFRKGAFAAAIIAQVPIIPVIFAPYTFIIQEEYYRVPGKQILEILPPVSTEGLTIKDVDFLSKKVRYLIQGKYRELHAEVLNKVKPGDPILAYLKGIN